MKAAATAMYIGENVTSTAGLIVAYVNSRYIILTSKKYTDNTADISVKANDNEYKAVYVCSDSNTGISIISVDAEQMSEDDRTSIEAVSYTHLVPRIFQRQQVILLREQQTRQVLLKNSQLQLKQ